MNFKKLVRERRKALLSLDRDKILAYHKKYGGADEHMFLANASDEIFWGSVHKARTASNDLSETERDKSRQWLAERGWEAWG